MNRLFHGRQGTASAVAGQIPGLRDPADPSRMAKAYSNVISPVTAAATMHDDLGEEVRKLANGSVNIPIHPAQVPTEGSDTQETEGDSNERYPTDFEVGAKGWIGKRRPQPGG